MYTKEQALHELAEMGSHSIVSGEWANSIGEPFGITFEERHFEPNGDPKGPLNVCDGVDVHLISSLINLKVGGEDQGRYTGRGTRFRAEIAAALEAIKNS